MRRRLAAATFAALLAAIAPARSEPATLEQATLAIPAFSFAFSLEYLAEDLHLYEKHGVKIAERDIAGLGAINAVISGSIELALASGPALTRAAARGQRLLGIVEPLARPVSQLVLRTDLAQSAGFDPAAPLEQRARVLKGRSIAVGGINTIQHAYVRMLAMRAGIDPESITVAPMAPASMPAAFATRQIDGLVEAAPWPQQAVLSGAAVMIASGPDGDPADLIPFANTVVVAKPETCDMRPALCRGVAEAFAEAADLVAAQPEETLGILKKRFPSFDDRLLAASFAAVRQITPHPPAIGAKDLENAERLNVEAGFMRKDEQLKSYDGLFTDKFLR
jgi:ABC-type nitrate/sulfonate/bicarbonate transport system substrate-binding protein